MLYCVQVLDEIGRSLNFSYGAAVLDLVREGRVTMGAALAGLSFSSALAPRPHAFLYRRPRPVSRAALITAPFSPGAWLCIALVTAAVGPLLHCLLRPRATPQGPDISQMFILFIVQYLD